MSFIHKVYTVKDGKINKCESDVADLLLKCSQRIGF